MEPKFGTFVTLCYEGEIDYLFDVESEQDLEDAIQYAFDKYDAPNCSKSTFELILEYLDNNKINYDYIDLIGKYDLEY